MKGNKKLIIMVSSTVYGIEELLDRIYTLLADYGYEVWISHKGTLPVRSDRTAFENCLEAVEQCDLFLGIITTSYGSVLMIRQCQENGLLAPVWHSDPALGVTVIFNAPEATPEVKRLLQYVKGEMNRQALQDAMGLKDAEHFRKSYLLPALEVGVIEMTIPDKPGSSKQQYRRSAIGKQMLDKDGGK
jgi:hypothetical protein